MNLLPHKTIFYAFEFNIQISYSIMDTFLGSMKPINL